MPPVIQDTWNFLERVLSVLTPLIIAWCGWKITTSEKESKRYRELREKSDAVAQKHLIEEKDEQRQTINSINSKLAELQEGLDAINADGIYEQIKRISEMTNANFEYSRSLSDVVMCMGDVLEKSDNIASSGRLSKCISAHRTKESEIVTRIVKLAY